MELLLDTHAALWYLLNSRKLSSTAQAAIEKSIQSGDIVFLSAISLVETIYLVEGGRVPFQALQRLDAALADPASGLAIMPVDRNVAEAVHKIPRSSVPDMPDRIIGATALQLKTPLVTRDTRLQSVGIRTLW